MRTFTLPLVLALAAGIYAQRLVGMFVLRPRQAQKLGPVLSLVPVAVVASVVVSQTFSAGRSLVIDARIFGVTAAALALWRRAPIWVLVPIAVAVTALARRAGWAA